MSNLFSTHDLAAGHICINTGNLFGMEFSYRFVFNKMSGWVDSLFFMLLLCIHKLRLHETRRPTDSAFTICLQVIFLWSKWVICPVCAIWLQVVAINSYIVNLFSLQYFATSSTSIK